MLGSKEARDKKRQESMGESTQDLLKVLDGSQEREEQLKEVRFWTKVVKKHFATFYSNGVNCEQIFWKAINEVFNFFYKSDRVVKRFFEYHYGKDFDANKSFNDEFDTIFMREFLEMYTPKIKHMIINSILGEL